MATDAKRKPRKKTITLRPGEGLETDGPAKIVSQRSYNRRGHRLKVETADGLRVIPRRKIDKRANRQA